jgi:hypothetical protein
MYSPGLSTQLDSLSNILCTHSSHSQIAGGRKTTDGWNSKPSAAYPPDLCLMLANALASLGDPSPPTATEPIHPLSHPATLAPLPHEPLPPTTLPLSMRIMPPPPTVDPGIAFVAASATEPALLQFIADDGASMGSLDNTSIRVTGTFALTPLRDGPPLHDDGLHVIPDILQTLPVSTASSLRLFASAAAAHNLTLRRYPVLFDRLGPFPDHSPNEYYYGTADNDNAIYRLRKPLRGSPNSTSLWLQSIVPYLTSLGFTELPTAPGLFHLESSHVDSPPTVLVALHSDCLCTAVSNTGLDTILTKLAAAMSSRPYLAPPTPVANLLDIDIDTSLPGRIVLRQHTHIASMVSDYIGDLDSRATRAPPTPADDSPSSGLHFNASEALRADSTASRLSCEDTTKFRSLISSLEICANGARPDISYAVSVLRRCSLSPTLPLLDDAFRALRYLRSEPELGITYTRSSASLAGMSDSDWSTGRSTTGWAFLYGNAAISWSSAEQPTIALSTCEAEVMAASSASDEAIRLDDRLRAFGLHSPGPISLSVDNMAARDLTYNPEHHDKTKHLSDFHLRIRLLVEAHRLTVPYVRTEDNYSDFFTKALKSATFMKFRSILMNF